MCFLLKNILSGLITELRTDASLDNFVREISESIASLPPTEPKPKRKSLESSSSRIDVQRQYFQICDNLGQHINMRFVSYPCFFGLLDSHRFVYYSSSFPPGLLDSFRASPYGKLFIRNEPSGELQLLYQDKFLSQPPDQFDSDYQQKWAGTGISWSIPCTQSNPYSTDDNSVSRKVIFLP